MRRTAGRPLPSGRLAPVEAARLRHGPAAVGLAILLAWGQPARRAVALATFVLYVVGLHAAEAVDDPEHGRRRGPGALPPVIGWAAATGPARDRGVGPVPDRLPLAVPPLPGDRLDLPRGLRPRRPPDAADRSTRPGRSPAARRPATPWPWSRRGSCRRSSAWPARCTSPGRSALGLFYLAYAAAVLVGGQRRDRPAAAAGLVPVPARDPAALALLNPMPA